MTPADIAALRTQTCKIHAELGAMLLALEDAESLLHPAGLEELRVQGDNGALAATACSALAHERAETACGAAEAAAAQLAELIGDLDRLTTALAPKGFAPADRITIPPDEFSNATA